MRSFRVTLALRITAAMTVGVGAVAALSYVTLQQVLDREVDASIIKVASIQAATVTDDPSGEMHFHEWELTPEEAASIRDLNRYAQVWSADGRSLLRTRYLTEDLPLDTAALRQAAAGDLVWTEGVFQGVPIRSLYYPLERMGEIHLRHVLQVAAPLEARNRMLNTMALLLALIVLTTAGSSFVGGWWLAGSAVRPVDTIIDQAEAIASGRKHRRIEAFADTREYQRLVRVLNRMLSRLDALIETQRRFTADASHELRSPLTALRGELEVARRRSRTAEEYERVIDSALEEVDRLSRLAEDLLTLTRSEAGVITVRPQEVDLAERAGSTVERLGRRAREKGITVNLSREGDVRAAVDPDLVDRILWNLVENALKFTPPGGSVDISVRRRGNYVVLDVLDSGPGIPEELLPHIFERFFRADQARARGRATEGTGLGLSIVKALVGLHGGKVSASNRRGGGARFRVVLPVRQASLSGPTESGPSRPFRTARHLA